MSSLEKDKLAEAPQKEEVTPLPVSQMKKLIENTKLLTSWDRAIFQCWVLGCKPGDLHRQQRVFLPKHNLVLIRQQKFNSPSSFIRYAPSTKEQFERVWKQSSELKVSKHDFYKKLLRHIQRKPKSYQFTPGSIPEGSVKFLRDCGVSDKEITNITGDGPAHLLLNPSSLLPQKNAPREQINNITKLIKAIFPDGKY